MRDALDDQDLHLVWNDRLKVWVVAVWDPSGKHPPMRMSGCEFAEDPTKPTHWVFVAYCARPIAVSSSSESKRPFEAIEPGEWIIPPLRQMSQRKRDGVPTKARYSGGDWAQYVLLSEEARREREDAEDSEAFVKETAAEIEAASMGRVITHGRIDHDGWPSRGE